MPFALGALVVSEAATNSAGGDSSPASSGEGQCLMVSVAGFVLGARGISALFAWGVLLAQTFYTVSLRTPTEEEQRAKAIIIGSYIICGLVWVLLRFVPLSSRARVAIAAG